MKAPTTLEQAESELARLRKHERQVANGDLQDNINTIRENIKELELFIDWWKNEG